MYREEDSMRESGILLHITSLPEPGGIGTLGQAAYNFVDFLHDVGMTVWQVLPVGPTGFGDSPYQSASTFAGNPLLIDMKLLEKDGLLEPGEFKGLPDMAQVDFEAVRIQKDELLRKAFARGRDRVNFGAFLSEYPWAADFGLFMALKKKFENASWQRWPDDARLRRPTALDKYRRELKDEIEYHIFVQKLFFDQWHALREYANGRGVKMLGDMPIYVAEDSADAWANPEIFQFDEDCRPIKVAGVPPDYFSEDGQLWGNPLYDWKKLKRRKFDWWMNRLRAMAKLYDMIRVDHFIGFANYYAVPAGAKNARVGKWNKAPGRSFFRLVKKELRGVQIIAEDLGEVNNRVKRLQKFCGYPGLKVLTFAFDGGETNPHLPQYHEQNCVVYTGTHDNNTVLGWWSDATEETRAFCMQKLNFGPEDEVAGRLIAAAFESAADLAVIPAQDFLRLGVEARMNLPGTVGGGNWRWRMTGPMPETVRMEIQLLNQRFHRGGK